MVQTITFRIFFASFARSTMCVITGLPSISKRCFLGNLELSSLTGIKTSQFISIHHQKLLFFFYSSDNPFAIHPPST